jgi:sugar lactone lactonase YvrE
MTKTFTRPGRAGHFISTLYRYVLAALLLCAGTAARAQYAYHSQFGSQGTANGQFNRPVSIAVDYDGFIYVADQNNHRVQRYRADGTYNMTIGGFGTTNGKFNFATSVAVDQLGFVYVADYQNKRVQRFTPTGLWNLTVNGTDAAGIQRFDFPHDVDVDKDGNIYVLTPSKTVVKYNVNGEWVKTFTLGTQFNRQYSALAVDPDGNFFVTDAAFNEVYKYSAQGVLLWTIVSGGEVTELNEPIDVILDKAGNVLVLDEYNDGGFLPQYHHHVLKFDANKNYITSFGTAGTGNGQVRTPQSLALDPNDNLLVADWGNYRVQRFTALPEADVKAGTAVVADNTGSFDFGSTTVGTSAVARTFTISNATGARPLTVSNPTLPAGFGLTGNFPATITAGGTADFTVTLSPAALGALSGTLSFSTNDPDENPYNFTISGTVKQPQTITFDSIPDRLLEDPALTLAATASSGLPVTYTLVAGAVRLNGATLSTVSTGKVIVRASQEGNAQYSAAPPVERTYWIKRTQTISFYLPELTEGTAIRLGASSTSLLPIIYSVVSGPATLSGDSLRVTGAGEVTVKASQAGGPEVAAAPDNIQKACSRPVPVLTSEGITLKSSSPTGNQWLFNGAPIAGATGATYLATAAGSYYVLVQGPCGQPVRSAPFVVTVSATEPALFSTSRLYPNPTAGWVTLALPAGVKWQLAAILDGQGRQVLTQPDGAGPVTFSTHQLANGLYLLRVRTTQGEVRRKFLVQ